jgi:hypothetical protein
MMEAARTSETLVNFYQTTRCYNPEDSHLSEKKVHTVLRNENRSFNFEKVVYYFKQNLNFKGNKKR